MRRISFVPKALENFVEWVSESKKIHAKIVELVKDIQRNSFSGIGKPEPLRHELKGLWARRITAEHCLVYEIKGDEIIIHSCKFHYEK